MPPYIGEIRLFAGNFGPAGWSTCRGQILPISEYDTLFNLIGTTYGGDGQETFGLPDLQGRVPLHMGNGAGATYVIGEALGTETVTITQNSTPIHTHPLMAGTSIGGSANPQGNLVHQPSDIRMFLRENPDTPLPAGMISPIGGSQPHDNMPPVLTINYIISLFGIYPSPT